MTGCHDTAPVGFPEAVGLSFRFKKLIPRQGFSISTDENP